MIHCHCLLMVIVIVICEEIILVGLKFLPIVLKSSGELRLVIEWNKKENTLGILMYKLFLDKVVCNCFNRYIFLFACRIKHSYSCDNYCLIRYGYNHNLMVA